MKHTRFTVTKFLQLLLIFVFFVLTINTLVQAQHPVLQEIYQFQGWTNGVVLGHDLLNPGDLNNDGYDEFISYSFHTDKALFYWGSFPVDTIPDLIFYEEGPQGTKRFWEAAVANIDGDSLIELIIPFSSYYYYETYIYKLGVNADTLPDIILDKGGAQICTGDLNGDGFDDIVLANSDSAFYAKGRILIYMGGELFDTQPDYVIIGDSSRMRLGHNIAAGDLNGDGYDDLIAWGYNNNISVNFDYIRIYFGSAEFDTVYDVQLNDPTIDPSWLGFANFSLASFDYNKDGYDDLFVGGVFVYNGSANFDTIPEQHLVWPNNSFNAYVVGAGWESLFNAGDINKDGYPDLAIGMSGMFGGKGLVHVKLGGPLGLDEDYIIIEPQYGNAFGESVVNIGDIDGNGVSDLLIGEPYYLLHWHGKLHFYSGDSTIIYDPPVGIPPSGQPPYHFQLFQNYPNPFNATTIISFIIDSPAEVELIIYDIEGKKVKSIFHQKTTPGKFSVSWDGLDGKGGSVSSGIYFYRLKFINLDLKLTQYQTKKLVYLK